MTTMYCRKCDQRAAIRMRQHRLSFCRDHYLEWFVEQTQRTIERYHMFGKEDRILLAVSGGKDSLALWDVIQKLGYSADGLYINLGIESKDDYSNASEQFCRQFAETRGLRLHVENIEANYGRSISGLAWKSRRGRHRPCAVCGLSKRHIMNRVAKEGDYDVLVTAHNLDDEVAVLFSNTMNWQIDLLNRQYPVLEASDGFCRKVKPFCRFYERETAAYTLLSGIEYIEEECPFAVGSKQLAYKELLNKLEEEHPGMKQAFYINFLNAKSEGLFRPAEAKTVSQVDLHPCPSCGQPTSNDGLCAFCKTVGVNQNPDE